MKLATVLLISITFACCHQTDGIAYSDTINICRGLSDVVTATTANCTDPISTVARGFYKNEVNNTGWAVLEIETLSDGGSDDVQAYAAGVAEGLLTRDLIHSHWINTVAGYCEGSGSYCNRLYSFISDNLQWMKKQIEAYPDDPYWHQVRLMLIQLAGLEDGYYKTYTTPHMNITPTGFIMFQISGDLEDLEQALQKPEQFRLHAHGSGSCSALIMPLPDNSDLYFAHDTWSTYQGMLRIQKHYKFAYNASSSGAKVPAVSITLSSYPGTILSVDDFYLMSSGLAVTETTIGNDNATLYKYIQPIGQVLTWVRVMVANRLATSGQDWVNIFKKRNSGTYNNQFMIIDYRKFTPGQPLPKAGLFYVLEQIPGYVEAKDMTTTLKKQGYWPSYNVAYFPKVFNMSGQWDQVRKYGDWYTYDKTPRALIFKRDHTKVTDMDSLRKLMRYNDYTHDPLSRCNCTPPYSAENAISARNDLNPANGTYPFKSLSHRSHGGTDMKATNYEMFKRLQYVSISGPTYDSLPPFTWSKSDFAPTTPHVGHPDVFKFEPVTYEWALLDEELDI